MSEGKSKLELDKALAPTQDCKVGNSQPKHTTSDSKTKSRWESFFVHLWALMKKRLYLGILKLMFQLKNLTIYPEDWFPTKAVLTVLQDIFYSGDVFEPVF